MMSTRAMSGAKMLRWSAVLLLVGGPLLGVALRFFGDCGAGLRVRGGTPGARSALGERESWRSLGRLHAHARPQPGGEGRDRAMSQASRALTRRIDDAGFVVVGGWHRNMLEQLFSDGLRERPACFASFPTESRRP